MTITRQSSFPTLPPAFGGIAPELNQARLLWMELELKPRPRELAIIYNNRANARISRNDLDGTLADYGKAIEAQPNDFENYYKPRRSADGQK